MYLLGQKIKNESTFKDFLSTELKTLSDVYVLASHTEKTLSSAQIFMYGLLGEKFQAPSDPKEFDTIYDRPRLPWHDEKESNLSTPLPDGTFHFPVHSVNRDKDKVFTSYQKSSCSAFNNFGENLVQNDQTHLDYLNNHIIGDNKDLQEVLRELDEADLVDMKDDDQLSSPIGIYFFSDYLEAMRAVGKKFIPDENGKESPEWIKLLKIADYYKSLYFFEQKAMTVQLNYLIKDLREKVKAMYFEKDIVYPYSNNELYESSKKSEKTPALESYHKLVVYTGHDVNLWAFINTFGLTSSECLRKKIDDPSMPLEDFECQGNPDFSSNLSLVLKRPKSSGLESDKDTVYIGGCMERANPKRCIRGRRTSRRTSRKSRIFRMISCTLKSSKAFFWTRFRF